VPVALEEGELCVARSGVHDRDLVRRTDAGDFTAARNGRRANRVGASDRSAAAIAFSSVANKMTSRNRVRRKFSDSNGYAVF